MLIDKASVYTPQLVVYDEKEMVGGDAKKVPGAVENALKQKSIVKIILSKVQILESKIIVSYTLNNILKNTTMQAALVQKQAVTITLTGENSGARLNDYNIAREFIPTSINAMTGQVQLNLPSDIRPGNISLVFYVQ